MQSLLHEHRKDYFNWMNEPTQWSIDDQKLVLTTQEQTDFWKKTHYGFERMNGHVYYRDLQGDFETEIQLIMEDPSERYDQAGLFIMISEDCWLKTFLEWNPDGDSYLGSVVTNSGYSDRSSQNFTSSHASKPLSFKVKRTSGVYQIWAKTALDEGGYKQVRIATLHEDDDVQPIRVGLYACSPSPGSSFTTTFHEWTVQLEVQ